ncbi:ABC transporter ATP-binding protein [Aspergillus brunneoviolaceus CBS 621.78]|uniref:Lipid A export ATP-binding/permease protein msbA n=1 Tax=Aspergillus brunneoviolaceus CBS 621.78 TaxID=1450534 RepID=A0ACD1GDM7_9EURO|nr:lipid A export ATP-binding/permease protein msbA [Aspergillus brunneoviolaceus CBS 621.78]RAH47361.1 lipid A export ATP-binding/permease protein msbA [Aspergillus brunneoviolaceus CBS 621.78]
MGSATESPPPHQGERENTLPAEKIFSVTDTSTASSTTTSKKSKSDTNAKDATSEQTASLGSYFRLLSHASASDRAILAVALLSSIGSGVPLPLMNIVFGNMVGEFNGYFTDDSSTTEAEFKSAISKLSLYIVYLFIAKFALTYFSMYCFRVIGLRVSGTLRLRYMHALFAQPISKLDLVSVGTVTNTITTLSNSIQQSISDKLAILFQSLALLVAAYVIAFRYSWALTLVTSAALVFIFAVCFVAVPMMTKIQRQVDKADEKHSSIAAEVIGSIRTVVSLGAEGTLAQRYADWIEIARLRGRKLSVVMAVQLGLVFFAMYASYSLAFWFGLKLYREGHIQNINTVITVFFSVMVAVSVLGRIASPLVTIAKAASAAGAFFEMIDSDKPNASGLRGPEVSAEVDLVFQNVHFTYPSRPDSKVLKGLNARFRKHKTTALVGPSGSGKSTIVGLLERWYELNANAEHPDQGAILVGEHNVQDLDLKWWRTQIGLVQQEPILFNDTIFNNIAYGLIGTQWEHESDEVKKGLVQQACREAFADEFIDRLPEGFATMVGENGTKLSGGQRQRLAIARSIVKQPTILILDEATSAIDVRGEKIVQAALDRLAENRTTIVIAHRLTTIRKADHIIVMKGGVDVEQGTHEELLAIEDGVYSGLVNAQTLELLDAEGSDIQDEMDDTDDDDDAKSAKMSLKRFGKEEELEKSKNRGFFGSIGVFLYENRGQWRFYFPALIGAAGAGAAYPIQSWLFARIIQVFQYSGDKLVHAANFWALMFLVLALGNGVCYALIGYSANRFSVEISSYCRTEYFQHIIEKPIPFHDRTDNASGSLVSRLATDPKQVQELLGINGALPCMSIFGMIGCIIIAFTFGWKLSLVAVLAALPCTFLAAFMRIRYEVQFDAMNAAVYSGSSQFAAEAIDAFRTVSALTMEDAILNRYSTMLLAQQKKAFHKAWYATLVFAFSDSVELCAMALTFWYGGQLLASREYEPTSFFVIYMAIIQGGQQAGQFFSFGSNIAQAIASANRMLDFRPNRNENPQQMTTTTTTTNSAGQSATAASISFRDVTFRYASHDRPLFTGLNLDISPGQFVAFVGPSGCGKTTVISLLERFYSPAKGTVLLNDQDITTLDPATYRKTISLVAQEPRLFEGTIRENITLGLPNPSEVSDAEIEQACRDAEIHDFITSLPQGYATELGIKAQAALSGGQRQRLCIARALLRKPKLLLLDEATSSLDSQSEKVVQAALERLAAKRCMTIVAVAHRLATIQKADVIFVFGEGGLGGSRVVEQGTHAELVGRRGIYYQMVSSLSL